MIRPATFEDLPALAQIEEASQIAPWSQSLLATCLEAPTQMFVAQSADGVCGWGAIRTVMTEAEVMNVAVSPAARRQGWGLALMRELIHAARLAQAETLFLEVRVSNDAAQNLYEQLGFIPCGLRPGYYPAADGREDALMMELLL